MGFRVVLGIICFCIQMSVAFAQENIRNELTLDRDKHLRLLSGVEGGLRDSSAALHFENVRNFINENSQSKNWDTRQDFLSLLYDLVHWINGRFVSAFAEGERPQKHSEIDKLLVKWMKLDHRLAHSEDYFEDLVLALQKTSSGPSLVACFDKKSTLADEGLIDLPTEVEFVTEVSSQTLMSFSVMPENRRAKFTKWKKVLKLSPFLFPPHALVALAHEFWHTCSAESFFIRQRDNWAAQFDLRLLTSNRDNLKISASQIKRKSVEHPSAKFYQEQLQRAETKIAELDLQIKDARQKRNETEKQLHQAIFVDEVAGYNVTIRIFNELSSGWNPVFNQSAIVSLMFGSRIMSLGDYVHYLDHYNQIGQLPELIAEDYTRAKLLKREYIFENEMLRDDLTAKKANSIYSPQLDNDF